VSTTSCNGSSALLVILSARGGMPGNGLNEGEPAELASARALEDHAFGNDPLTAAAYRVDEVRDWNRVDEVRDAPMLVSRAYKR
jgi:hypothetical protein